MRNFITKFILVLIVFILSAFTAESPVPDSRITEAFGQKYVDFLTQKNPDLIMYYNFYLENSYKIVEIPNKPSKIQLKEVKIKPEYEKLKTNNFNILLYDIQRYFDKNSYYTYKGKLLVVLSEGEFMDLYNTFRKKQ